VKVFFIVDGHLIFVGDLCGLVETTTFCVT